jgi:hypothetical protein
MMSPDLHTLTGAYAMHALPEDERLIFEEHLRACDACSQEVAELVATAARLGAAAADVSAPPPGLREAILVQLPDVRQEPPSPQSGNAEVTDISSRRSWLTNLAAPAAAVVAIAVIGLAATVANLNGRLDQVETTSSQVSAIMAAPDLQMMETEGPDGSLGRVVMTESRGEAIFLVDGMPAAAEDEDFALWLIGEGEGGDSEFIPAGAFDVDASGRATQVVTGDLSSVSAIGVTAEPEDEPMTEPTSDPVMLIEREQT